MSVYISAADRQLVHDRAHGCCEYCLIPEAASFASHEIDHIVAQKHGGPSTLDNLALSCTLCNKYKGSDLASIDPNSGDLVPLYNPRQDLWNEHFRLERVVITPLTGVGRATTRLFQLNTADRIAEREPLVEAGLLKEPRQGG